MNEIITFEQLIKLLIEHPKNDFESGRNSIIIQLLKGNTISVATTNTTTDMRDCVIENPFAQTDKELLFDNILKQVCTSTEYSNLSVFPIRKAKLLQDYNNRTKLQFVEAIKDYTGLMLKESKDLTDKVWIQMDAHYPHLPS